MTPRAIICDVYGTLLEVGPAPADADARWHALIERLGRPGSSVNRLDFSVATSNVIARVHQLARAQGIPFPEVCWPSIVAAVLPEFSQLGPEEQQEFLYQQMQSGHTVRLTPQAADTLELARRHHCLLGIASNAQAYTVRELQLALEPHGIGLDWFEPDLRFWSFENGFSKPDPHVFRILTARLEARGIRPPEILMIGDRHDHDLAPASAQGWLTWPIGPRAEEDWAALYRLLRTPKLTA